MNKLDLRRSFRNRFGHYVDTKESRDGYVRDGSQLTLRDLCVELIHDPEPFPCHAYRADFRDLCEPEHLVWLRGERSYGDVARLLQLKFAVDDGHLPPLSGRWVAKLLGEASERAAGHRHAVEAE